MRVLSVDPGFGRCGVAILEKTLGNNTLVYSTCIETPKHNAYTERLVVVGRAIEQLIKEYNPNWIAIEELFFSGNKKTALNIAEVRGIILFIAGSYALNVAQLNPLTIKTALTGYGRAPKDQIMRMVEKIVKLPEKKMIDDEYDAIAIGIAALAIGHPKTQQKIT